MFTGYNHSNEDYIMNAEDVQVISTSKNINLIFFRVAYFEEYYFFYKTFYNFANHRKLYFTKICKILSTKNELFTRQLHRGQAQPRRTSSPCPETSGRSPAGKNRRFNSR